MDLPGWLYQYQKMLITVSKCQPYSTGNFVLYGPGVLHFLYSTANISRFRKLSYFSANITLSFICVKLVT